MIHLLRNNGTYGIQIFGILLCIKTKQSRLANQINFIFKIYKFEMCLMFGKENAYAKEFKKNLKNAIKESKNNVAST